MNRDDLIAAFDAAVESVDPERATADVFDVTGGSVAVGDRTFQLDDGDTIVVAIGKAAPGMARGVASVLGPVRGIAVSDHREACPVEVMIGGHPVPDSHSIDAGRALLDCVASVERSDFVVFLISGGGSALAEVPADGVSLSDLEALNSMLLRSGLPIESVNEVRSAVSDLKGGHLGSATRASRSVTLVLSDVVGAGPQHVASGPTIGFGLGTRANEIIDGAGLRQDIPNSVISAIDRFTPASGVKVPSFVVIGSPCVAASSAQKALAARGEPARIVTSSMTGDLSSFVWEMLAGIEDGVGRIAAGEVTIEVTGTGLGGRNQHAALVAAREIEGSDVVFGAFGTDGRDGPTDAAGAVVDGSSVQRMRDAGVDVDEAIASFDSNEALDSAGDLVVTGPTGTNVADLWIAGTAS